MWTPSVPSLDVAALVAAIVVLHVWAEWNLYDRTYDQQLQPFYREFEDRIFFGAIRIIPHSCNNQESPTFRR